MTYDKGKKPLVYCINITAQCRVCNGILHLMLPKPTDGFKTYTCIHCGKKFRVQHLELETRTILELEDDESEHEPKRKTC
jgi:hypothetical protein